MKTRFRYVLLICFLLTSGLVTAWAQTGGSYDLSWSSVDGGGGRSGGGAYGLIGSAGQPDAGSHSGGPYGLRGGVFSFLAAELIDADDYPANLYVSGNTGNAPIIPVLNWTHKTSPTATTVPASQYRIYVQNTAGTRVINQVLAASSICSGVSCSASLAPYLDAWGMLADSYQWWVGAIMPNGTLWSNGPPYPPATFTVSLPTAALPANVNVDTSQVVPTITWDDDPNTFWFHLIILGGGEKYNQWHGRNLGASPATCDGNTCTVTPSALVLTNRDYTLWTQTWGPGGFSVGGSGGWLGTPFTVAFPQPAPPTLNAVPNIVDPSAVTFSWNLNGAATGAAWIQLKVYEMNRNDTLGAEVYNVWKRRDQVCGSFSNTGCSFPLPVTLPIRQRYGLLSRTWGPGGMSVGGPNNDGWSALETFTLGGDPPSLVNFINVTASTSSITPSWSDDPNADWFHLIVIQNGVGTVHNGWHGKNQGAVPASCGSGSCSVTLSGSFPAGNYTVWAEAWGSGGGYTFGGANAGWTRHDFTISP